MFLAFFQANTKADIITPTITAIARSVNTVTTATVIPTRVSDVGMRPNKRKLAHSNVPSTTINITPTSAATGIISIRDEPTKMNANKNNAAAMPDVRPRPPELMLIILCPIMAQPPMPPKKPVATLATPWPTHSLLLRPRVSVISSISVKVSKDSINPMAAKIRA